MRAVVLSSFGDTSHFHMADIPTPSLKDDEVRIKIRAVAFNPVDYKMREGAFPIALPAILGADCAGIVESAGKLVTGLKAGDEVIAFVFGQGSNGTYAEFVTISCHFVVKKPKNMSFEEAAAVPLVGLTAFRALESVSPLGGEASIFIAGGGGGVGSITIQLAKALGNFSIITTAGGQEGRDYLTQKLGLSQESILLYKGLTLEQKKEKLIALNKGRLFSAAFDFVGGEEKHLCFSVVDFCGHVVSIVPEEKHFAIDLWARGESPAFAKNLAVHFIFIGAESFAGTKEHWTGYKKQLEHLARLIENDTLSLPKPAVVGAFSVETVKKAHSLLESGRVKGKLVMTLG